MMAPSSVIILDSDEEAEPNKKRKMKTDHHDSCNKKLKLPHSSAGIKHKPLRVALDSRLLLASKTEPKKHEEEPKPPTSINQTFKQPINTQGDINASFAFPLDTTNETLDGTLKKLLDSSVFQDQSILKMIDKMSPEVFLNSTVVLGEGNITMSQLEVSQLLNSSLLDQTFSLACDRSNIFNPDVNSTMQSGMMKNIRELVSSVGISEAAMVNHEPSFSQSFPHETAQSLPTSSNLIPQMPYVSSFLTPPFFPQFPINQHLANAVLANQMLSSHLLGNLNLLTQLHLHSFLTNSLNSSSANTIQHGPCAPGGGYHDNDSSVLEGVNIVSIEPLDEEASASRHRGGGFVGVVPVTPIEGNVSNDGEVASDVRDSVPVLDVCERGNDDDDDDDDVNKDKNVLGHEINESANNKSLFSNHSNRHDRSISKVTDERCEDKFAGVDNLSDDDNIVADDNNIVTHDNEIIEDDKEIPTDEDNNVTNDNNIVADDNNINREVSNKDDNVHIPDVNVIESTIFTNKTELTTSLSSTSQPLTRDPKLMTLQEELISEGCHVPSAAAHSDIDNNPDVSGCDDDVGGGDDVVVDDDDDDDDHVQTNDALSNNQTSDLNSDESNDDPIHQLVDGCNIITSSHNNIITSSHNNIITSSHNNIITKETERNNDVQMNSEFQTKNLEDASVSMPEIICNQIQSANNRKDISKEAPNRIKVTLNLSKLHKDIASSTKLKSDSIKMERIDDYDENCSKRNSMSEEQGIKHEIKSELLEDDVRIPNQLKENHQIQLEQNDDYSINSGATKTSPQIKHQNHQKEEQNFSNDFTTDLNHVGPDHHGNGTNDGSIMSTAANNVGINYDNDKVDKSTPVSRRISIPLSVIQDLDVSTFSSTFTSEQERSNCMPCYNCKQEVAQFAKCSSAHICCVVCLFEQIKIWLASNSKDVFACEHLNCTTFYKTVELRKILPEMLVDVMEDKLEMEYVASTNTLLRKVNSKLTPIAPIKLETDDYWPPFDHSSKMEGGKPYCLIDIDSSSKEFEKISKLFHKTMTLNRAKVVKVRKILNPSLWQYYSMMKDQRMRHLCHVKHQLERMLFHGVRREFLDTVCVDNVDWRTCGISHGIHFGEGTYFARDASYAHQFTDKRPHTRASRELDIDEALEDRLIKEKENISASDLPTYESIKRLMSQHLRSILDDRAQAAHHGESSLHPRYMLLSRVFVGRYTVGRVKMRKPPPIDPSDPYGVCYNSLVNYADRPTLFVISDPNQYYPEYIIEYTNKPREKIISSDKVKDRFWFD